MPTTTATVRTDRPERYIKQLVSHMGRKIPAELATDGTGTLRFPTGGRVTLTPTDGALILLADATDAAGLAAAEDVVARHLIRFAAHEQLTVTWRPVGVDADAEDPR
ncbi:hypothetical protein SAMN05444365_104483 [Micromonospora pattaloongensis]|uniref:DUF2218 domain-containing protein n=1 Tax=Micromonospora pattaloongensis TaxID=405436 RepID=A0A1H3PEL2_9ACTN|nr:DUF2218 domain-containing protein [Micromonospora pattaloongensis]SDY99536.1 hypothetical protein SAMN05444365_104483 [Micromonospora pattaloongensis]